MAWFADVAHVVRHRIHIAQRVVDRAEVRIGQATERGPRHDRVQRPALARVHHGDEGLLRVGDARFVLRQVAAECAARAAQDLVAAGEQARIARRFPGGVAAGAIRDADQVAAERLRVAGHRTGDWLVDRSGSRRNARALIVGQRRRRQGIAHWRQRPQVNHHGRKVLVRQPRERRPPHGGVQRPSIVTDPFADGPGQHVVSPGARARLGVRRDVGRDDASIAFLAGHHSSPLPAGDWRCAGGIPVALRMADKALQQVLGQVPPPLHPRRARLEDAIRQRPLPRMSGFFRQSLLRQDQCGDQQKQAAHVQAIHPDEQPAL